MSLSVLDIKKGTGESKEIDKKILLNDHLNDKENHCAHPLFVCLAYGNLNSYTYKCICVNCGTTHYFRQYELNQLFEEHRVIDEKVNVDIDGNLYNLKNIQDYYNNVYEHFFQINDKIHSDDILIDSAAAEMTFNHFVYLEKGKKFGKQLKKTRY